MAYKVYRHDKRLDQSYEIAKQLTSRVIEEYQEQYGELPLAVAVNRKAGVYVKEAMRLLQIARPLSGRRSILIDEHWLRVRPVGYRILKVGSSLVNAPLLTLATCTEKASTVEVPEIRLALVNRMLFQERSRLAMIAPITVIDQQREKEYRLIFDPDVEQDEVWIRKEQQS